MFLLVPAHPGGPGQRAVIRLFMVLVVSVICVVETPIQLNISLSIIWRTGGTEKYFLNLCHSHAFKITKYGYCGLLWL